MSNGSQMSVTRPMDKSNKTQQNDLNLNIVPAKVRTINFVVFFILCNKMFILLA